MKVSKKHLLGTEVLHLCIVFAGKNVTHYYQSSKCLMHTPKLTCLFYRMESNRILIQMKLNTKTVAHKKSKRTVIVSTKGSLGTSTSVAVWREGLVEKVYCTLKKKDYVAEHWVRFLAGKLQRCIEERQEILKEEYRPEELSEALDSLHLSSQFDVRSM